MAITSYLEANLKLKSPQSLGIVSDAITVSHGNYILSAESGTTDNLATISGGSAGDIIALAQASGHVLTVKHGTGNIYLGMTSDIQLNGRRTLWLQFDGSYWVDINGWMGGLLGGRPVSSSTPLALDVLKWNATSSQWEPGTDSPGVRVRHSANQTVTTGAELALAFDTEDFDSDGLHDTITNNTRLTCKAAGKYVIYGSVALNTTGRHNLRIKVNGSTVIATASGAGDADENIRYWLGPVFTIYHLSLNDYVELILRNDSGATRTIYSQGNQSPVFGMQRISS